MVQLRYTRDEIMADHDYAQPQIEAGYRLHGGFDASGNYVSPRTLNRWPAVKASTASCRYFDVILRIAGGMVAENNAICLYSGVSARIRSTSSAKPICTSASASTLGTPTCARASKRPSTS